MGIDPYRVYSEGEDWRRGSLAQIWPELAKCLARADEPKAPTRCAIRHHNGVEPCPRAAVARVSLNGHPGCPVIVEKLSKRPGGYPLALIDPKEWRE